MRVEYYLQLGGGIGPGPGQGLAVSAPGGVELDQHPLLVVLDLPPPVGLGELDHVLDAARLGVGLAYAGLFLFFPNTLMLEKPLTPYWPPRDRSSSALKAPTMKTSLRAEAAYLYSRPDLTQ